MAAIPDSVDIIIVGGGPVGLTSAVSLWRNGFKDILVVDSLPEIAGKDKYNSRAVTMHPGTLEALDRLDCAESVLRYGTPTPCMNYTDRFSPYLIADFGTISAYTKYPYFLMIPQDGTEEGLGAHVRNLGIPVHRNQRVVALRCVDEGFELDLESGDSIAANHVVGADGAKSSIRSLAGIAFRDPKTGLLHGDATAMARSPQMVLADVTFRENPTLPLSATITSTRNGIAVVIGPLPESFSTLHGLDPSKKVYRVGFSLSTEASSLEHPSQEQLQELLDRKEHIHFSERSQTHKAPTISRVLCSNRFRVGSAAADSFIAQHNGGSNVILLLGDAGHVHPPTGGQGMNLGIRDGVGVGPAFAAFARGDKAALSSYATKRRLAALQTIRNTGILFGIIHGFGKPKGFLQWLGYRAIRMLGRFTFVKRVFAWRLSGLADLDT